jgi:predicted ester cyclase
MASSKVRKVFDEGVSAFNRHDMDAFTGPMADDVRIAAPGAGEIQGKVAARGFYRSWIDAFPDCRVEIDAVHVLEDTAIEEGHFVGTHRATLRLPDGDIPATGRSVRVDYMQVVRFRGDEISSFHLVFDRMEMLEQLGLGAEEEPAARSKEQPGAGAPAPH